MIRKTIVRVVVKALIPFILLFALYTQFHGDFGPGGGFQAGVILAAAFIAHLLVFGLDATQQLITPRAIEIGASLGVLIYGGVGLYSVLMGANFLDYGALQPHHPEHGQHWGILLVELGVGLTVSCVMMGIIGAFTARGREIR